MAANEEELSIGDQKYPVIYGKSNKNFTQILLFSFFPIFASSSHSLNNDDNCKKMMLVNRYH